MKKINVSKEKQAVMINEIREYFENERDESIGDLQGQLVLEFILEKIGPHIYNQAISDMQGYMSEKIEDMYEHML